MRILKSHPLLKLANGHIICASQSTNLKFKFSSPYFNYSKRHYSNSKLIPKPSGTPFEIPYAVMDSLMVDHIINNHSIASLKEVIDNLIFSYAAKIGLLVIGDCYEIEVFIPLTIPGKLQMLDLFKYDSDRMHIYFSYNDIVKSGELSTALYSIISEIANSDHYKFTGPSLLFKFTPYCIPQGSDLGESISTHTFVTAVERYSE